MKVFASSLWKSFSWGLTYFDEFTIYLNRQRLYFNFLLGLSAILRRVFFLLIQDIFNSEHFRAFTRFQQSELNFRIHLTGPGIK